MRNFLRRTKISLHAVEPVTKRLMEALVLEGMNRWEELGLKMARWKPFFRTACDNAYTAYGHTRVDVQAHIAQYTILTLAIDDFVVNDDALDAFSARLLNGAPQLDPILDCLVDSLRGMPDFFPSYAAKCIVDSTIQFVDGTLFDKQSVGLKPLYGAQSYVEWRRRNSGVGFAYEFFIWDKFSFPDIYKHIQVVEYIFLISFHMTILC